jgi:hypothetical protein
MKDQNKFEFAKLPNSLFRWMRKQAEPFVIICFPNPDPDAFIAGTSWFENRPEIVEEVYEAYREIERQYLIREEKKKKAKNKS